MKHILEKLHAVMTEVDFIEKDGVNSFHKYKYASEFAIKTRLHDALVKHRVVFYIARAEMTVTEATTAKGNSERLTSTVLTYRFCDVDSGESIEGQGIGQGQDPGDKGAYKAITGALKYILTTSFIIPTGDDPEADEALDKRTSASAPAKAAPKEKPAPAAAPKTEHELAVEMVRELFQKLPEKKRNLDTMKAVLPISDFGQVKECTIEQLNTGIDRLNAMLEGK